MKQEIVFTNGGLLVVTIRNWFKFFLNAMLIGGSITGVFSLFIRWNDFYAVHFSNGEWAEFFTGIIWFVILGFTMSVIAQMGFFAYLTVHQIGVNIFRSLTLWNWVQMLIIVVTLVDLVLFRFKPYAHTAQDWLLYIVLLLVLLAGSIATAIQKTRLTKKHVLVPALFFMIVVTTLEWLIALWVRTDGGDEYVTLLLFPLLAVNAYQLLVLPKYNAKSDEDRLKLEERRKARRLAEASKVK